MTDFLSVQECANLLAVEHKTIRRLIDRGELPALRVGRVFRIARADLAALAYRPAGSGSPGTVTRPRPRPVVGAYSRRARGLG